MMIPRIKPQTGLALPADGLHAASVISRCARCGGFTKSAGSSVKSNSKNLDI